MDIRRAQIIIRKVEGEYVKRIDSVKWNQIYSAEKEIVDDLKNVHIPDANDWYGIAALYKGYEYIHSFARQVQAGKELTEKQMRQCKRLALEIKKAASIKECY
jgi:hypothetical protein